MIKVRKHVSQEQISDVLPDPDLISQNVVNRKERDNESAIIRHTAATGEGDVAFEESQNRKSVFQFSPDTKFFFFFNEEGICHYFEKVR